jgi:TRAP-type uncharacterized transport system substrate-binding protein
VSELREATDDRRARRLATIAVVAGLLALVGLFAWLFGILVPPAPPRSVTMSTGPADGAYHAFALRYREYLARYGIDLILKQSAGSVENLDRLRQGRDGVQIALVQGGVATGAQAPGISTLGSVFYEPMWLFWHGGNRFGSAAQLRGKRIAVGAPGSGTRALALILLKANGLDESAVRLDPSGGMIAAQKLESGALDAAIFVSSPEAPALQRLLRASGVRLASATRASAYERQFAFLHQLRLPAGSVDLAHDVPSEDKVLLATTANLLVRDDLHPVIVDLLLEAARNVHGGGGLLTRPGEFPSLRDREFPVSDDVERLYRGRYSFLREYLPFWVAVWVQRFVFFAIPLLAIGIPLLRWMPMAYGWAVRRRIYRCYNELKRLERALQHDADLARYRGRLEALEARVGELKVPMAYANEYYTLRVHIALQRRQLDAPPRGAPQGDRDGR